MLEIETDNDQEQGMTIGWMAERVQRTWIIGGERFKEMRGILKVSPTQIFKAPRTVTGVG